MTNTTTQPLTFNFYDGNEKVPAHRHINKNGDTGGWVADTAMVDESAYIGENAVVYGEAEVYGNAVVTGFAQVYGNAQVSGNAMVSGNAWVYGKAMVYGYAQVSGNAQVYGNAQVFEGTFEESPMMMQCGRFTATMNKDILFVGCQRHLLSDWMKEGFVEKIAEKHQATPFEVKMVKGFVRFIAAQSL
jgi:tetrahydrodipicolinate N-succinyltransferase